MAYIPHALLTFGGTLGPTPGTNTEIWSCGIRILRTDGDFGSGQEIVVPTLSETQDQLANYVTNVQNYWGDPEIGVKDNAYLEWVKFNAIGADGKYLYDTSVGQDFTPIDGPTGPGDYKPFQVAKVVTTETGLNRGLASRGRYYLPSPANGVTASGYTNITNAEVEAHADFLSSLFYYDNISANGWRPAVVSSSNSKATLINAVSVDNVLDTQRRRRNQLTGTRVTRPVDQG